MTRSIYYTNIGWIYKCIVAEYNYKVLIWTGSEVEFRVIHIIFCGNA